MKFKKIFFSTIASLSVLCQSSLYAEPVTILSVPVHEIHRDKFRQVIVGNGYPVVRLGKKGQKDQNLDIYDSSNKIRRSNFWALKYEPNGLLLSSFYYFPDKNLAIPLLQEALKEHGNPGIFEGNLEGGDFSAKWKLPNKVVLEISRKEEDNRTGYGYINLYGAMREYSQ